MKLLFFIILTGLIVGGIFTYINLPSSIPGDLIYPLKKIYEKLQLAANELSYEKRAQVFTELSNNRLNEFEKLVKKKDDSRVPEALDQIILMERKALDAIEREQSRGTNTTADLSKIEESFTKQLDTLKKLYFEVSPENYILMDRVTESIQENLNRLVMLKNRR